MSFEEASPSQATAAGIRATARAGRQTLRFSDNFVEFEDGTRMVFTRSAAAVLPELRDRRAYVGNYLKGEDPAQWQVHVAQYARLVYPSVQPGVDLVFYGNDEQLEYDFVVQPGASLDRIELTFEGTAGISLLPDGDLLVASNQGTRAVHRKPVLYQQLGGRRIPVEGRFLVDASARRVRFAVSGEFDHSRPLVIDPVMTFSSYLGGSALTTAIDEAHGIAQDPEGNIYVAGWTAANNFPVRDAFQPAVKGAYDAFVVKFAPNGKDVLYATYLGGVASDYAYGLAVDSLGQAHVVGGTGSSNFPLKNAIQSKVNGLNNAFVAKLNAKGDGLIFSTIFGGDHNDTAYGVALDDFGNVIVAGATDSGGKFPLLNPLQPKYGLGNNDGFIAKFTPEGQLVYSTYLGGTGADAIYAVAVDRNGAAVVTGQTTSPNMATPNASQPKIAGANDVFVAKLHSSGASLVYYTYLGGRTNNESGRAIAVDGDGNAYVGGQTFSSDFPVTQGALQSKLSGTSDAFLAKVTDLGTELMWSTLLGGSARTANFEDETINAVGLDPDGYIYIAGNTNGGDFPNVRAVQGKIGGGKDGFVAKLTPNAGAIVFSTFVGGQADDEAAALVVTPLRAVWIAGNTLSMDYPLEAPLDTSRGGSTDAAVSTVCDPVLFLSGDLLEFTYTQGGDLPVDQRLQAVACASVDFFVEASERWASLGQSQGRLAADVIVGVKPESLDPGDYTATVTITVPDSYFAPVTRQVTLHLLPPPPPGER